MNEKEMLMRQLRANAFPHNNGKVMQAINIIRHGYNRLTDVQQAAQIWGVSQNDFLDCINFLALAKVHPAAHNHGQSACAGFCGY